MSGNDYLRTVKKGMKAYSDLMRAGKKEFQRDQKRMLAQYGGIAGRSGYDRWSREERAEAEELLIYYLGLRSDRTPEAAGRWLFSYFILGYERFLRFEDQLIQASCKENPPGRMMRVHYDPCAPGFKDYARGHWRAGWATTELRQFESHLRRRAFKPPNYRPKYDWKSSYLLIGRCYEEYWWRTNPAAIQKRLRGELMMSGMLETLLSATPLVNRGGLAKAAWARLRSTFRKALRIGGGRAQVQPKAVPITRGKFGEAPHIRGRISVEKDGVTYEIDGIITYRGNGKGGAGARDAATVRLHRAAIVRAAKEAQAIGHKTFKVKGKQANPNFRRHAEMLNQRLGVGKDLQERPNAGAHPDITVELSVSKVQTSNATRWTATDLGSWTVGDPGQRKPRDRRR